MYAIHKLRLDPSLGMILLPVAVLAAAAAAGALFGISVAYGVVGAIFLAFAAYSGLTFLRTGNTGFVIVSLFQLSASLASFLYATSPTELGPARQAALFFVACMVFFGAWSVLLAVTRRIKWRGREILEIAAASVDQSGDGYTPRPMPVGKTDFSRQQVLEFASFARRNLIAATYVGPDRVVFVPVAEGHEPPFILGLRPNYLGETWVSVDSEGNVSANIAQRDYLAFREALAFDRLCASLGSLFVDLIEMHRRGERVRILDRLDAAGLPFYA